MTSEQVKEDIWLLKVLYKCAEFLYNTERRRCTYMEWNWRTRKNEAMKKYENETIKYYNSDNDLLWDDNDEGVGG